MQNSHLMRTSIGSREHHAPQDEAHLFSKPKRPQALYGITLHCPVLLEMQSRLCLCTMMAMGNAADRPNRRERLSGASGADVVACLYGPDERGKRWLQAKVEQVLTGSAVPLATPRSEREPSYYWGKDLETETTLYLMSGERRVRRRLPMLLTPP